LHLRAAPFETVLLLSDMESAESSPDLAKKELGIQWETIRDLIQWDRVPDNALDAKQNGTFVEPSKEPLIQETERITKNEDDYSSDSDANADTYYNKMASKPMDKSFEELSRCRIDIPRRYINDALTDFIRRHRQRQSGMILSYWLRVMDMKVMEDICAMINERVFDDDDLHIYADWIARDKEESSKERGVNQSRFFEKLQSIRIPDADESKPIADVTITFKKTVRGYSYSTEKTTLLHLHANGCYVFDLFERNGWSETEAKSDSGEEQRDVIRHCGIWDYEGDEIIMEGFGFTDLYDQHQYTREERGNIKTDHQFSSKLAIRRPLPFKQPKDTHYKRKRFEKCDLSVVVYF